MAWELLAFSSSGVSLLLSPTLSGEEGGGEAVRGDSVREEEREIV